jgi:6-phosphogluconate dehydrogenase (decarboxylating)
MKRDLDLVRQILLAAEAEPSGYVGGNPEVQGHTEEQVGYHVYLMHQAGLVEAANTSAQDSSSPTALLLNLTWKGHDFLDAAKNGGVWAKAKDKALAVGGSLSFELMKDLLVATARDQLGLPPA